MPCMHNTKSYRSLIGYVQRPKEKSEGELDLFAHFVALVMQLTGVAVLGFRAGLGYFRIVFLIDWSWQRALIRPQSCRSVLAR